MGVTSMVLYIVAGGDAIQPGPLLGDGHKHKVAMGHMLERDYSLLRAWGLLKLVVFSKW